MRPALGLLLLLAAWCTGCGEIEFEAEPAPVVAWPFPVRVIESAAANPAGESFAWYDDFDSLEHWWVFEPAAAEGSRLTPAVNSTAVVARDGRFALPPGCALLRRITVPEGISDIQAPPTRRGFAAARPRPAPPDRLRFADHLSAPVRELIQSIWR